MDPIVFAIEEKNIEFQTNLKRVYANPYIIRVRNENGGVQLISLFNKTYCHPGISITCPLARLTYEELCFLFLQPVSLGLIVVRIIESMANPDIMGFMKFDFVDKDGRSEISVKPIYMYEDVREFEEVMYRPIDVLIKPLTYINFSLPQGAEIEIMLFEKDPAYKEEEIPAGLQEI